MSTHTDSSERGNGGQDPDEDLTFEDVEFIAIARADAVVETLSRMSIWEARNLARIVESITTAISEEEDAGSHAVTSVPWQGPELQGSQIVPPARRIDAALVHDTTQRASREPDARR